MKSLERKPENKWLQFETYQVSEYLFFTKRWVHKWFQLKAELTHKDGANVTDVIISNREILDWNIIAIDIHLKIWNVILLVLHCERNRFSFLLHWMILVLVDSCQYYL